ncbi:MAG: hypothetical protein JXB15_17670 [Anaerolineales bacterium]|nr:hypothetical protein [Anaerolineales bacterium]
MTGAFKNPLEPDLLDIFSSLTTPLQIQDWLDSIPYVGEELNRSPLRVVRDRQAHCLDGGLFAAAALRMIGYPALILDLVPEPGTDDDHVLALFQQSGLWGALAKSNFSGLRYREPLYRSLRELCMSYFEDFFNVQGQKTLRGYTRPMDLSRFDRYDWLHRETGVEAISTRLYSLKSIPLLSAESAAALAPVDRRSYEAGLLGTNYEGLFKPA